MRVGQHPAADLGRLIVPEPLGGRVGVWNEVPESTYGIAGPRLRRDAPIPT
jgi:hypothetical protein